VTVDEIRGLLAQILAGALLAACLQACDRGGSRPSDDTSLPRAGGATTAAAAPTCAVDARTALTGEGIGALRVGATVGEVGRACRILRDTTALGVEGMPERTILVDLGRDSVLAVIVADRVWRVHVRSRRFRTADSLGVGTPANALRRPAAQVLAGEGAVFVRLPSHCGLSFRLRGATLGRVSTPTQIPDSAVVDEVLAFGCSASPGAPPVRRRPR
jgi:hypothetical protein